jgi:prepilin-type N-terminal cleavage/methylation domain-containing protein
MSPTGSRGNSGFTFLELAIVLVLLGLVLFLAVPRLQDFASGGKLEKAARKMVAVIRHARGLAAGTGMPHLLNLDIEKGRYWISMETSKEGPFAEDKGEALEQHKLPSPIKFKDVETLGKGPVVNGIVSIHFWANGLVETSLIHLRDDQDRNVTLILNPLSGSVEVLNKYVVQKVH